MCVCVHQLWIMITYYAAQFGITLSIVDLNKTKLRDNDKPNENQSKFLHKTELNGQKIE